MLKSTAVVRKVKAGWRVYKYTKGHNPVSRTFKTKSEAIKSAKSHRTKAQYKDFRRMDANMGIR